MFIMLLLCRLVDFADSPSMRPRKRPPISACQIQTMTIWRTWGEFFKRSSKMGQVISLLETGDMYAHDRASQQAGQMRQGQAFQQQYYGADRLGGGPLGTGYAMPNPMVGSGTVTINPPAPGPSATQCAGAVATGAGAGFVGGAAGGTALGNAACPGLPPPWNNACRAGSSFAGGMAGGYAGGMQGANSPFCPSNPFR